MARKSDKEKLYYFVDIELPSRRIVGWGIENREQVETKLTPGFHRLFLSKGQYNKLVCLLDTTI